jgi:hypothetical protein
MVEQQLTFQECAGLQALPRCHYVTRVGDTRVPEPVISGIGISTGASLDPPFMACLKTHANDDALLLQEHEPPRDHTSAAIQMLGKLRYF